VTYLDMAVRGRGTSSTPKDTVRKLSELAGVQIPGGGAEWDNRIEGLAPLTGIVSGVGTGSVLGVARASGLRRGVVAATGAATALALVGTNGPMTVLGITDPRSWSATDWVSDVVPHLVYGFVTAAVLHGLDREA
jgi:hypothetical protein